MGMSRIGAFIEYVISVYIEVESFIEFMDGMSSRYSKTIYKNY